MVRPSKSSSLRIEEIFVHCTNIAPSHRYSTVSFLIFFLLCDSFKNIVVLFYVHKYFVHICTCAMGMLCAETRESDPLELGLHVVVNCHVGAEN